MGFIYITPPLTTNSPKDVGKGVGMTLTFGGLGFWALEISCAISSGTTATPAPTTAPASTNTAGDFSFSNISVTKDDFGSLYVNIDVTDTGKDYQGAIISASFYDASGNRVGKASGAISGIKSKEIRETAF